MSKDEAQKLYKKKNKPLDLDRDTDVVGGVSFFLSISPIFLMSLWFLIPMMMFLSVSAIVIGMVSLVRIDSDRKLKGRAWAIAGMILGLIGFVIEMYYAILL